MAESLKKRGIHAPHVHVPYDSLEKYIPFLREHQLNPEIYFGSRSFDRLKAQDILELKKQLDYDPRISIHAPFMDLSPGAVDLRVREVTIRRYIETLEVAEVLMPEAVVFHSGYDRWKYDNRIEIWLENSLETWKPVTEKAEELEIHLAIENIFEDDPENLRLLCTEMNSDYFGICFDTGHFNLFSKLPLTDWLAPTKRFIKELHLHDNTGESDQHLAIGDGNFDFKTLFAELNGINCIHTLEAHTRENALRSLERLKEFA